MTLMEDLEIDEETKTTTKKSRRKESKKSVSLLATLRPRNKIDKQQVEPIEPAERPFSPVQIHPFPNTAAPPPPAPIYQPLQFDIGRPPPSLALPPPSIPPPLSPTVSPLSPKEIDDQRRRPARALPAPPPSIEDVAAQQRRKKQKLAEELLETEIAYVEDLHTIIEAWLSPSKEMLAAVEVSHIFSNVETLLAINQELLVALERSEGDVGTPFASLANLLGMYTVYCTNQSRSLETIEACKKKNGAFARLLETQRMHPKCKGLSIHDFLIKPLQRICKYPLFLKDLLKLTPTESEEHKTLEAASEAITAVVNKLNQNQRLMENSQKILEIQQQLAEGEDLQLLAPGRVFLKEGLLGLAYGVKDLKEGKLKDTYCYLFNDLFIVAQKKRTGMTAEHQLPLQLALLNDFGQHVGSNDLELFSSAFELVILGLNGKNFVFFARSPMEKQEWVNELRPVLDGISQKEQAMHKQKDSSLPNSEEQSFSPVEPKPSPVRPQTAPSRSTKPGSATLRPNKPLPVPEEANQSQDTNFYNIWKKKQEPPTDIYDILKAKLPERTAPPPEHVRPSIFSPKPQVQSSIPHPPPTSQAQPKSPPKSQPLPITKPQPRPPPILTSKPLPPPLLNSQPQPTLNSKPQSSPAAPGLPPKLPEKISTSGAPQAEDTLTITQQELDKYDQLFRKADVDQDSFINGQEAKAFFGHSGLPQTALKKIWILSDVDRDGQLSLQEFRIAMYYIYKNLDGEELPSQTPSWLLKECKVTTSNGPSKPSLPPKAPWQKK